MITTQKTVEILSKENKNGKILYELFIDESRSTPRYMFLEVQVKDMNPGGKALIIKDVTEDHVDQNDFTKKYASFVSHDYANFIIPKLIEDLSLNDKNIPVKIFEIDGNEVFLIDIAKINDKKVIITNWKKISTSTFKTAISQ